MSDQTKKPSAPTKAGPSQKPKESPLEELKRSSRQLRGEIGTELVDGEDHFGKDSIQLLKHHGTYQQDNRDARTRLRQEGKKGKEYIFMVRTKMPGGVMTGDQLLAELELADETGNTTLRITGRQGLQLHGVVKDNLKSTIRRINEVQLTTLGACGDVNRNVMCCPGPFHTRMHREVQALAQELGAHFAPRTTAYHELWVTDPETGDKELVGGGADSPNGSPPANGSMLEDPIYGTQYLPRKFKMGIGFPHDNCIDIYTHDLGFLAVVRDERVIGYNVLVGGGQGLTPSNKQTFPALAKRMAFIEPGEAVAVAEAVVKVQRDFGNRSDRKLARLKYLIHDWGLDKFKAKVQQYYGKSLDEPEADDVHAFDDHIGWHEQGDGKVFYGLNIENGRIYDDAQIQLKTALREICRQFSPGIRLTSHQSMLLTDLAPEAKEPIEGILKKYHVPLSEETSTVRRWSMACVAWPTCGLSITESERALPGVIDQLEAELARLGLSQEKFTVRMTGCPNGCARPYNSDVGLVGKARNRYTVYLGGRLLGNRLNFIYKDLVPEDEIVSTLSPLLLYFKQQREEEESFGDFCNRKGQEDLESWAEQYAESSS